MLSPLCFLYFGHLDCWSNNLNAERRQGERYSTVLESNCSCQWHLPLPKPVQADTFSYIPKMKSDLFCSDVIFLCGLPFLSDLLTSLVLQHKFNWNYHTNTYPSGFIVFHNNLCHWAFRSIRSLWHHLNERRDSFPRLTSCIMLCKILFVPDM